MIALRKDQSAVITTYVSDKAHGGIRPGDKADNAPLMALARKLAAAAKPPAPSSI
ncbi:MAG: hypothetical protein ING69_10685 [Rhodocyclaceae bacterium]|nr:hypothetical protein [Rhodocyclaceae bacterium]